MLHMAKITFDLLRELSTRNAEAHVKPTTGQQRRLYRFAQKAHRARRWIYRSVQQKGLTVAWQQIQKLEQDLDGQAEPSPAMARGAGTVWALAQRYPICIPIPSTLALVMRKTKFRGSTLAPRRRPSRMAARSRGIPYIDFTAEAPKLKRQLEHARSRQQAFRFSVCCAP
ncbi:hypothetical protein BJX99DRAFT_110052 [Aspergillus californicus]